MMIIPIQPLANQSLQVQLANQPCTIQLTQTAFGLFCNLYISSTLIIGGVLCENLNRIVRSLYLGFVGDLVFNDLQGSNDPIYQGLGSRYQLVYLKASDLAPNQG
jgi:hypothetical protein